MRKVFKNKNTENQIRFVVPADKKGNSMSIYIGQSEEMSINPDYLKNKYSYLLKENPDGYFTFNGEKL